MCVCVCVCVCVVCVTFSVVLELVQFFYAGKSAFHEYEL